MLKNEIVLYGIILSLVVNLPANMIWKYIPGSEKHIDKIITAVLIIVCILLIFFNKEPRNGEIIDNTKPYSKSAEFITGSHWNTC